MERPVSKTSALFHSELSGRQPNEEEATSKSHLPIKALDWEAGSLFRFWYLREKPCFKATIFQKGSGYSARFYVQPWRRKPRPKDWKLAQQGEFSTIEHAQEGVEAWANEWIARLEEKLK